MDEAAQVHRASFDCAVPWLVGLHTPEEDRWFYRERVFSACEVWGSFDRDVMTGLIAFRDGWIDQLYVLPPAQGHASAARSCRSHRRRLRACSFGRFSRTTRRGASMSGAASF